MTVDGTIVCGGLASDLADRVRQACEASHARMFDGCAASPAELQALAARIRPEFVVLPETWLRDEGLGVLAQLRESAGAPSHLVVGTDLPALAIAQAIPLGLRGLLEPEATAEEISRAIAAVRRGELWIERRRVLEVLNPVGTSVGPKAHETWHKLPTLTEREHAVLVAVLEGRSNKDIARKLEISERTVKVHLQHLYHKLGVHRRVDLLAAYAGHPSLGHREAMENNPA